ncbi:GAF and ANTAR domain-containing protein [Amycolatopsis lurida]
MAPIRWPRTNSSAASALLDFSRSLRPDESRSILLERISQQVVHVIGDADAASVTLYDGGAAGTIAATDAWLLSLDEAQYAADDGPCLRAAQTRMVVRTELDRLGRCWPELARAAAEHGVHTALSCPLFMPTNGLGQQRHAARRQLAGALNVWSFTSGAFDPLESALIAMFSSAASAIILTAGHWAEAEAHAVELVTALETRDTIATAKGIVMARLGYDADEAFRWLVEVSQKSNRKVRDLAALIIADASVVVAPGR